jgi:predicted kinase
VDGTHHLERTRVRLRGIAAEVGLPAVAVMLSTPLDICLARQQGRPAPTPGKQYSLRVPERQVREIEDTIREARSRLAEEGFIAHVLRADATAPEPTSSPDRL